MKARILFLDDNEERVRKFLSCTPFDVDVIVVRDAETAIDVIAGCDPNILFLDHDLGGEEMVDPDPLANTGTAVVKFLVARGWHHPSVKRIIVHSLNVPARTAMVKSLKDRGLWEVWDAPFTAWDWERIGSAWANLDL